VLHEGAKEQVRSRTDIVELIGRHLDLRRQGRIYVGRCPWHDDRRPSLQVNPDRQTWKCWVCDIGGDVFSFVMKREGCDFAEALRLLAERAGISLAPAAKKAAPGSPDDKATLYQCCEWAARQFQSYLREADGAQAARAYLAERTISPASVERFQIGFSPNDWTWLLDRARNTPYSAKVLEAVGLVGQSDRTGNYYDRFRGRVIFPIRDTQGRTIAFGGRILPGSSDVSAAKYVNSPETRLYSKSDTLYALDLVRDRISKSRALTVVEGYTDVILCHQHGVEDVVACCGTALGERHIRLLKRFADTVYLVLDGDAAGQARTNDILELFVAAQMDLRILTLPEELDPAEFMEAYGGEAFRALLSGAVDALEHKIRTATRGIDLVRDTHRANVALEEILTTIARGMPADAADPSGLRAKQILARVARQFALDEGDVRGRFQALRRTVKSRPPVPEDAAPPTERTYRLDDLAPAECELVRLLAAYPELAPTALAEISEADLASETAKVVLALYRQLEENGHSLDFVSVLTAVEAPELKNLLVAIDEDEARRSERQARRGEAIADPATRLRETIGCFRRLHLERERRQLEHALAANLIPKEQEVDVFDQIVRAKRQQQGISAPTDG